MVLRALSRTWRVTIEGSEILGTLEAEGSGYILSLWHGRMLLGLSHHGGRQWSVLVSASRDGDISNALLERFGYRVIRGSSSALGVLAAREMLTALEKREVIIVTPDGPNGPRHSMNPGVAWLARTSGFPVVPVGFACDRAWRTGSWDRFTIPKPWARVVMIFAPPIRADRSGEAEDLDVLTEKVREGLFRAETRGFALLGLEPDW